MFIGPPKKPLRKFIPLSFAISKLKQLGANSKTTQLRRGST